jgi:hypothetical protein
LSNIPSRQALKARKQSKESSLSIAKERGQFKQREEGRGLSKESKINVPPEGTEVAKESPVLQRDDGQVNTLHNRPHLREGDREGERGRER